MTIQLDPPIPLYVPEKGVAGLAYLVTDYGPDHDRLWTVFLANGEVWDLPNPRVRAINNISLGRSNGNK